MNPFIDLLQPYPFAKLRALMNGITVPDHLKPIHLHIGEPKHATAQVVLDAISENLDALAQYPASSGTPALRRACAHWCKKRYDIDLNIESEIIPTLGSREALFSLAQAVIDSSNGTPLVIAPNPFYQIYEGATLLAGAQVRFANCPSPHFLPMWHDISDKDWKRVQLVFVCSPSNPTGALMQQENWEELFDLQEKYDFVIASDECYSEIYFDENNPPLGILQAASKANRSWHKKVMLTSLSKRSNVPGLRSGFVAGDANILRPYLQYRTYHGCAMSGTVQAASIAAWSDETHVKNNRAIYREKFARVLPILQQKYDIKMPDASFYIWLPVNGSDTEFAQNLWHQQALQVLPGSFLARETPQGNAGAGKVRIALVAPLAECEEAAYRLIC